MFIPDPGAEPFPSLIQGQKDSGSRIRIRIKKKFVFLTQKIFSKLSEIWSGIFDPDPDPGSGSWFFTHPGSWIQGSNRQQILDPDPQYCLRGQCENKFGLKYVIVGTVFLTFSPTIYKDRWKHVFYILGHHCCPCVNHQRAKPIRVQEPLRGSDQARGGDLQESALQVSA